MRIRTILCCGQYYIMEVLTSKDPTEPGTASSEFFICAGNQPELDFGGARNTDKQEFAAFGKVTKGMDMVLKIQKLKDKDQYLEKPVKIIGIARIK